LEPVAHLTTIGGHWLVVHQANAPKLSIAEQTSQQAAFAANN